jgi:uncharacterized membrane protein YoaK (UPF0700 family)
MDRLGLSSGGDARHGPLPPLLIILTVVTGLVDAVSYLDLGNVFVANMTGNVVFLGFAVADVSRFSVLASLAAIAAFLLGALLGGRLTIAIGQHRGRLLAVATAIKIALVGVAVIVSAAPLDPAGPVPRYALIVLLAVTMGLQNATARRLGVPDLTTTVLTLTLTGLAADSALAGGPGASLGRRLTAVAAMFLGAAIGALLLRSLGITAALALALALLMLAGAAAYRAASSAAAWTVAAH